MNSLLSVSTLSHISDTHSDSRSHRRVLIVSPHFPPINAPDHQRIRVALPHLQEFGWDAEILAVEPNQVPHPQDPLLARALPAGLSITRTPALPTRLTSLIGLGNVGWRSLPFLQQAGDRLLTTQTFDLIFFSTTIFPVMLLGPYWQHKFGIPYVLDFQDPWRSDYHQGKQATQLPGGRLKYGLTQLLARWSEPQAMRTVSHVISVSPAYPHVLQQRYPWLTDQQFTILPFGAPDDDFVQLPQLGVQQSIFDPNDGKRHWVYVGRGGQDMAIALRALFLAIQQDRDQHPDVWRSIQLHFVGTSYAPPHLAVKTIEPIAQACGVADLVSEHPYRISYFEAQQVLVESDGILLIGSDDPSYTASKLYPCILAQKPILAIFHQASSAVDILRQCRVGDVLTFATGDRPITLAPQLRPLLQKWLHCSQPPVLPTDWAAFQPYTARAMTQCLCAVFDQSAIASSKIHS
jgi:hypothetical protein